MTSAHCIVCMYPHVHVLTSWLFIMQLDTHSVFPDSFKQSAKALLLAHKRLEPLAACHPAAAILASQPYQRFAATPLVTPLRTAAAAADVTATITYGSPMSPKMQTYYGKGVSGGLTIQVCAMDEDEDVQSYEEATHDRSLFRYVTTGISIDNHAVWKALRCCSCC